MPLPSYWGDNWAANYSHVAKWARAASSIATMSPTEHALRIQAKVYDIEDASTRDILLKHASVCGHLLTWVHLGTVALRSNCRVPPECKQAVQIFDAAPYASEWAALVAKGECGNISPATELLGVLANDMEAAKKSLDDEDSGGHTSYSDYSTDDTDSDEEADLSSRKGS